MPELVAVEGYPTDSIVVKSLSRLISSASVVETGGEWVLRGYMPLDREENGVQVWLLPRPPMFRYGRVAPELVMPEIMRAASDVDLVSLGILPGYQEPGVGGVWCNPWMRRLCEGVVKGMGYNSFEVYEEIEDEHDLIGAFLTIVEAINLEKNVIGIVSINEYSPTQALVYAALMAIGDSLRRKDIGEGSWKWIPVSSVENEIAKIDRYSPLQLSNIVRDHGISLGIACEALAWRGATRVGGRCRDINNLYSIMTSLIDMYKEMRGEFAKTITVRVDMAP